VHIMGKARVVQSVVAGKELIRPIEVSAAENIAKPAANKGLVFLGCEHCLLS